MDEQKKQYIKDLKVLGFMSLNQQNQKVKIYYWSITQYITNLIEGVEKSDSIHISLFTTRILIDIACELEAFLLYPNKDVYLDRYFESLPTNQLKIKGQALTSSYLRKVLEEKYEGLNFIYTECCKWVHPNINVTASGRIAFQYDSRKEFNKWYEDGELITLSKEEEGCTKWYKDGEFRTLNEEALLNIKTYKGFKGLRYSRADNTEELNEANLELDNILDIVIEQLKLVIAEYGEDELYPFVYPAIREEIKELRKKLRGMG